MRSGQKLSDECKEHLETALQKDDPSQKNFHIRQVLQACGVANLDEELDSE